MLRFALVMAAFTKIGSTVAVVLALVAGCRHAAVSYELRRQETVTVVVPPAEAAGGDAPGREVIIGNARRQAESGADCDIAGPPLTLHWNGNTAEVDLKPQSYFAELGSEEPAAPGVSFTPLQRLQLAPLESLDAARNDILGLGTKGCASPKESQDLLRAVVEKLALPPGVASTLLFGSWGTTGVFDLTSDFRLQVISPVYAESASGPAPQAIGHEDAYYAFRAAEGDDRVRISLDSVSETVAGKQPAEKFWTQNHFPFPESFSYFRLLLRQDVSSHLTIATVLSAPDRAKLDEATRQRRSSPSGSCQEVSVPGATCISFPSNFGVNPELRVRVNGKEVFADRVREAMDLSAARPMMFQTAPQTLKVRRLFQGRLIPIKFDPESDDILDLPLMPGDEITW